jgi:hypothetical protein
MATNTPTPPRVFISYSHDSAEHEGAVLALANQLRVDGIDAVIDQYEQAPSKGWLRWMREQVDLADFVLVICTETYKRRAEGREAPGIGLGVNREAVVIDQHIYDQGGANTKFVAVVLRSSDLHLIPDFLKPYQTESVESESQYESLYRRITSQPAVEKPSLGHLRSLPPRKVDPHHAVLHNSVSQPEAGWRIVEGSVATEGPEIVVDYSYAEDSKDHHDASAPLILKNISPKMQAYSVEVLPLKTEFGTLNFEPRLISYIEAGKSFNVFVESTDNGPLLRRSLPAFLFKCYQDESPQELFAVKVFTLHIRYRAIAGPLVFDTQCELYFRAWKKQVTIGRIERQILAREGESVGVGKPAISPVDLYVADAVASNVTIIQVNNAEPATVQNDAHRSDVIVWTLLITLMLVALPKATSNLNLPPLISQFLAGSVLAGIVWKFFEQLDRLQNDQARKDLSRTLQELRLKDRVRAWVNLWNDTFFALFRKALGDVHPSWKGFLRSSVVTLCSFGLVVLIGVIMFGLPPVAS